MNKKEINNNLCDFCKPEGHCLREKYLAQYANAVEKGMMTMKEASEEYDKLKTFAKSKGCKRAQI